MVSCSAPILIVNVEFTNFIKNIKKWVDLVLWLADSKFIPIWTIAGT